MDCCNTCVYICIYVAHIDLLFSICGSECVLVKLTADFAATDSSFLFEGKPLLDGEEFISFS